MADPVVYDSNLSVFKLDDTGGTLRDISDYVVNVIPSFSRTMNPVTTLQHTHEQTAPGLNMTSIVLELVYSEDASVGTDTVLGPLLAYTTAALDWEYYPRGATGKKYAGTCWVENYQPETRVGNAVMARATLRCMSRTRT